MKRLVKYNITRTGANDKPLDKCEVKLVESIPEGLVYPNSSVPTNPSTYDAFVQLLEHATSSLELASSYWTLRGSDIDYEDPSAWKGEDIFKKIHDLATLKKISVKIAQNLPDQNQPNRDTEDLAKVKLKIT